MKDFEPLDRIQEVAEAARNALVQITQRAKKRKAPAFLFVNNRLEGCVPLTIEAVVSRLGV